MSNESGDASGVAACRFQVRVLLVDDNPVSNAVTGAQLRELGCEVQLAGNGREALAAIAGERFDLVLMDCDMPVMDGQSATRELRRIESAECVLRPLPVIAFTTYDRLDFQQFCAEAGMDGWLHKPCSREALVAILHRWTDAGADRAASAYTITEDMLAERPSHRRSFELVRDLLLDERGEELQALVELFVIRTDADLAALRIAVRAEDAGEVRRLAQALRTSAATLGALRLAELGRQLHGYASPGDAGPLAEMLAAIDAEYGLVREYLRAECRGSGGDCGEG